MAAAMRGIDALVFTGGVGENAPEIRKAAAERLAFLGVRLDERANLDAQGDAAIGPPGSVVSALVVHAREDIEIAREVRRLVGGPHEAWRPTTTFTEDT